MDRKPVIWSGGSYGWVPFPDEAIPPEDLAEAIRNEMAHEEEFMAQEVTAETLAALALACKGIISLSNPKDLVSNGEWNRAVAELDAALAPYRTMTATEVENSRLRVERDVARDNALAAIGERDAALLKIARVTEFIQRHPASFSVAPFAGLQAILGLCPLCGILGRIADAPCTHLGAERTAG